MQKYPRHHDTDKAVTACAGAFFLALILGTSQTGLAQRGSAPPAAPPPAAPAVAAPAALPVLTGGNGKFTIKQTLVTDLPSGGQFTYAISPDSAHLAILKIGDGTAVITRDGKPGKTYPFIVARSLMYSGDSQHFAYIAQDGERMFVVSDGVEGPAFFLISNSIAYNKDGKHIGYIAQVDKATSNKSAVIDGISQKPYDAIGGIIFNDKGTHYGYTAQKGKSYVFVYDGGERVETDAFIENGLPHLSPDGEHWGALIRKDDHVSVVIDGKVSGRYDGVGAGAPTFSPDGLRTAYGVGTATTQPAGVSSKMIIDGKDGPVYKVAADPVFSPDSKHVAYIALKGDQLLLVRDGEEHKIPDAAAVTALLYSPDSNRLAYVAAHSQNAKVVVVDDVASPEYAQVSSPVFSPDSKHLAFVMVKDQMFHVVLDKAEQRGYKGLSSDAALAFSPDGAHLAYAAQPDSGGPVLLVIDGQESPTFDLFLRGSKVVFDSPRSLHTLAATNKDFHVISLQVDIAP